MKRFPAVCLTTAVMIFGIVLSYSRGAFLGLCTCQLASFCTLRSLERVLADWLRFVRFAERGDGTSRIATSHVRRDCAFEASNAQRAPEELSFPVETRSKRQDFIPPARCAFLASNAQRRTEAGAAPPAEQADRGRGGEEGRCWLGGEGAYIVQPHAVIYRHGQPMPVG